MSKPGPAKPGIRVGVGVFEVTAPPSTLDLSSASVWQQTVLMDGVPIQRVDLASPGVATARLADAAITRRVDYWVSRAKLFEQLCARMGVGQEPRTAPEITVSVAVCTHGRPAYLPRLFTALAALDPAPLEVIIVDNAPGQQDCEAEARALGFVYLREDRRGLDNARNAAIRVARGDVIAFTDDDCVPSIGWLRALPGLFQDPSVGLVTGPMFPYALEARSQQHMEALAGMVRGYEELEFDWTNLSVAHGSAMGVGANMSFRRSVLEALGPEPFPPELDAGTLTESGGDTYVFGRLLAANHRMVYSPEVYGFHDHRRDDESLIRAVRGYGVGISAAMTRLLVADGELEAWRGWAWLLKQHARGVWRWLAGRSERRQVRLSREYITGGLIGPERWLRSLINESRMAPQAKPTVPEAEAELSEPVKPRRSRSPKISVVIPSGGFGNALHKCLLSLGEQTLPTSAYEVIVVDDRPDAGMADDPPLPTISSAIEVLRSGGRGASAARNLGAQEARAPIVLFLDDDMVASPTLLARHLTHHDSVEPVAVVGSYLPHPVRPGLAAKAVALWWSQHFETMRRGGRETFVWMLSGNLSVPRDEFLTVGGFPEHIPYRREDYEIGLRWLGAGHRVVYDPDASADHRFTLTSVARLRGVELEGFGDAQINRRYPGTTGTLPLLWHRPLDSGIGLRTGFHRLLKTPPAQHAGVALLDTLEAAKLRRRWMAVLSRLASSAYKHGLERGEFRRGELNETLLDVELTDDGPLEPAGPIPPTVRVTFAGRELVRLRPETGFWDAALARKIANHVPAPELTSLGVQRGWVKRGDLKSGRRRTPSVAVAEMATINGREAWKRLITQTEEEFLAVLIGDEHPGRVWLDEALLTFDGSLVGAAFGAGASPEQPTQPLLLFRRTFRPVIRWEGRPAYLVFRTEALKGVSPALLAHGPQDPLAFAFTLLTSLLEAEWTVGCRDVHGLLAPERMTPASVARAWTIAEFAAVGGDRRKRGARLGVKAVATAVGELRNGKVTPLDAVREAAGAISGARSILAGAINGPPDHPG